MWKWHCSRHLWWEIIVLFFVDNNWCKWWQLDYSWLKANSSPSLDIQMHFSGCLFHCKVRARLLQCVWKESVMWAHCSCPSGEHDPAVTCQNAKGLIDRPVLNCVFELISTVRPRYKGWGCPQSLFFSVVLLILSTRHSTQQPCGNVKMEWWCIFSKAFRSWFSPNRSSRFNTLYLHILYKPFWPVEQTHAYVLFMHEVICPDWHTHIQITPVPKSAWALSSDQQ